MKKKWILPLVSVLAVLLLSGCGSRTVEEMYKIPRRSAEYHNLQAVIDQAMDGQVYAAPVSGENQQTVQMSDLTGDGREEYIVYSRDESDKPMKILVFSQQDDGKFELLEQIESNGNTFEKVEYVDMDGKPGNEIVVGRRLNNQLIRIVSVYSFASGKSDQLMNAIYSRFLTCNLNEDSKNELMIIRHGDSATNNAAAVIYNYENGNIERSREADLSEQLEHIRRITVGRLHNGQNAVFIASAVNDSSIITDVFAMKNGKLTNIADASEQGTNVETLRNHYIYAEDIDEDGVIELPSLTTMKSLGTHQGSKKQHLIRWYAMDPDGKEVDKLYTYHNFENGWYLSLDIEKGPRLAVDQDKNTYTYFIWSDDFQEAISVFSIYALKGADRDAQAGIENRFALDRGEQVVYAAKLEAGSATYGITEETLMNSFHLIRMDWKSGET